MSYFSSLFVKNSSGAVIDPATSTQIGEVQATPTANTVLDRLKAIYTALTGTITVGGSVTANAGTNLNTSALATSAQQTSGAQKTQVTDSSGNAAAMITGVFTSVKGLRVYGGPTDPISDLPVGIPYDHHQLHEGETYRSSIYTASLGNGSNQDIRIVVPNITVPGGGFAVQVCPHFRFETICSADANIQVFEAGNVTGGTVRAASATTTALVNLERNSTNTPVLTLFDAPTVTTTGTMIWQGIITAAKNSGGGIEGAENEFVLKNNTTYLFRVSSLSNANRVLTRFIWYEDKGV